MERDETQTNGYREQDLQLLHHPPQDTFSYASIDVDLPANQLDSETPSFSSGLDGVWTGHCYHTDTDGDCISAKGLLMIRVISIKDGQVTGKVESCCGVGEVSGSVEGSDGTPQQVSITLRDEAFGNTLYQLSGTFDPETQKITGTYEVEGQDDDDDEDEDDEESEDDDEGDEEDEVEDDEGDEEDEVEDDEGDDEDKVENDKEDDEDKVEDDKGDDEDKVEDPVVSSDGEAENQEWEDVDAGIDEGDEGAKGEGEGAEGSKVAEGEVVDDVKADQENDGEVVDDDKADKENDGEDDSRVGEDDSRVGEDSGEGKESFTFILTRTPADLYRFRPSAQEYEQNGARARWLFAVRAVLYFVQKKRWTWPYLKERMEETRRGADLRLRSWDEDEDLAPQDRYLNSEERDELDKLDDCLSPTIAGLCRALAQHHSDREAYLL
jgi:hypothetical protein